MYEPGLLESVQHYAKGAFKYDVTSRFEGGGEGVRDTVTEV